MKKPTRATRPILVAAAATALACGACGRENPVSLVLIAPDGGDPFLGPGAATTARIIFDDDVTAPQEVPVGPRGEFQVRVTPADPARATRLRIEAVLAGQVIGGGATPPVQWGARGGQLHAVLLHRRDTLVPGPVTFATPRTDARLVPAGIDFVFALSAAVGQAEDAPPDGYQLSGHARYTLFAVPIPREFDGETTIVSLPSAWFLQRGTSALFYTGETPTTRTDVPVPAARQALLGATSVPDPNGGLGGWLVGGRDRVSNAPSTRVDRINAIDFRSAPLSSLFADPTPRPLAFARARPEIVPLELSTATGARWLVAGGQGGADPLLEVYGTTGGGAALATGDTALDARTGAAAVCVLVEGEVCTRVLVVGGRAGDALAGEDLLVDGECALRLGAGCNVIAARGDWLTRRRTGARAALAEGGRVLVAGGSDAAGASMGDVETIDVSDPRAPRAGRVVGTLPYADPSLLSLTNGSVMLAGGRNPDGTGRVEVWFYRY